MLRTAILVLCCLASACTSFKSDSNVFVSSTPAGAEIWLDDEPTGMTTPAMVEIGGFFAGDHDITLKLAGYEPETRRLRKHGTARTSRWGDGADENLLGWTWPFWWTLGEWFVPFELSHRYTPHEVHAVLYEEGKAPFRASEDQ